LVFTFYWVVDKMAGTDGYQQHSAFLQLNESEDTVPSLIIPPGDGDNVTSSRTHLTDTEPSVTLITEDNRRSVFHRNSSKGHSKFRSICWLVVEYLTCRCCCEGNKKLEPKTLDEKTLDEGCDNSHLFSIWRQNGQLLVKFSKIIPT